MRVTGRTTVVLLALAISVQAAAATKGSKADKGKIPVTTQSEEARALYLKAQELNDNLRATDAHKLYQEALDKDKEFALAAFGLAATSASAKEFFEATAQSVALAGKVSEPERLMIQAADAGARGQVDKQKQLLVKLVAAVPDDERAHNLLGAYYQGRQEYPAAIAEFQKAVALNPRFAGVYNNLGYAYRFLEKYDDAEAAFKKYIELIPNDPNPYDSYAELLMKVGRFDESIKNYQKALSMDPNFVASYVGIGNDQLYQDKTADARATFAKLAAVARTPGEKRQALFWTAIAYAHDGQFDQALAEVRKEAEIATEGKDLANLAADHALMSLLLTEADRPDEAAAELKQQLDIIARADVPAEVKEQTRRNSLFGEARIALTRKDVATARRLSQEYTKQVAAKKIPFEVRQAHELAGILALEDKQYATAIAELEQSNQQDPRVLFYLAVAHQGKGDATAAKAYATKAAHFNGLAPNHAYIHKQAKALLAKLVG